jgi:GDP-mannose 6-dehydrogenase
MRIAVMGLGYVGAVSGACLAEMGHHVIGVDTNLVKVDMVNAGIPPVIEKGFQEILEKVVKAGRFSATQDWKSAIEQTDMAMVCVGTPSRSNGSIDLKYVRRVSEHLGEVLQIKSDYYVVAVRSTVFPGTVEGTVIPILEKHSSKKAGKDFGICMMPEFLREGSSIDDFYNPPKTVIGEFDKRSGEGLTSIFNEIKAPMIRTEIKIAEMVKYADNSFHALKVAFANEIGNICKKFDFDSHKVMEIFCMDTKLNLSPYYLKPGFAFGGSCLPKDLRALTHEAKMHDIDTPVLNSILESNKKQILLVLKKLYEYKGRSVGFLGLSFKGGTDDLRESPLVELVENMIGKGFAVKIYDKDVSIAKLTGANKEYIEKEIPHISSLMCGSAKELICGSDVIVVGNIGSEFEEALLTHTKAGQVVIDLVRILRNSDRLKEEYYGICW